MNPIVAMKMRRLTLEVKFKCRGQSQLSEATFTLTLRVNLRIFMRTIGLVFYTTNMSWSGCDGLTCRFYLITK